MNKTRIPYLDYTWNPTHGCSIKPIAVGCRECWARKMAKRLAAMGVKGYDPKEPFKPVFMPDTLHEPSKVKKPSRIGVSFMGDLFHANIEKPRIYQVWKIMQECNWHTYIILTKRPQRMLDFTRVLKSKDSFKAWSSHIHIGVSISTQKDADELIPILLDIPAERRIISFEPALEAVNLWQYLKTYKISGLILGCESGNNRRPCPESIARSIQIQCKHYKVPFFLKQLPDENGKVIEMPKLDGKVWRKLPK